MASAAESHRSRESPLHRSLDSSPATPAETDGEPAGAFGGFIGPRTLVGLVRIAAPWLFDGSHARAGELPAAAAAAAKPGRRLVELGFLPLGWWSILLAHDRQPGLLRAAAQPSPAERTDYFALCLAAHWASVASYVPTDVDSKIRHALWFDGQPPAELERMRDLALALGAWDIRGVSARTVEVEGHGLVSGHDGERLSVHCGGMLGLLASGDTAGAAGFEREVDAELRREAAAFDRIAEEPGRERELVALAAILTHNAGDVMQGLAARSGRRVGAAQKAAFGELARGGARRRDRYGGAFGRAAAIYRELLASEGHRNYPLRDARCLREHSDLLLPLGPCLDDWGRRLARWPTWGQAQRAEVVAALVNGCRRVPGQQGYHRALAGFDAAHPGGVEAPGILDRLPASLRRLLTSSELRRSRAVPQRSFESALFKRARRLIADA